MTCLFGRIQVELNSGSSISDLYVAWGLDVKYPRSLTLCIRRTPDMSVTIHVKKCVLYTRNYGNPFINVSSKPPVYFVDISLTKPIFRKYLKEKSW